MENGEIIVVAAKPAGQNRRPEKWGTNISEVRGQFFEIFGVTASGLHFWPENYTHLAKCEQITDSLGRSRLKILDISEVSEQDKMRCLRKNTTTLGDSLFCET